jgi:hypothetical protein
MKMKQLIARIRYGSQRRNKRPIEERRWAVKVFAKGETAKFVSAIQLPLPKMPVQGWVEPSTLSIDELPIYFQLTEKIEAALLFAEPNDALMEAFKIEEFGIEADIFEVGEFSEATELVAGTED